MGVLRVCRVRASRWRRASAASLRSQNEKSQTPIRRRFQYMPCSRRRISASALQLAPSMSISAPGRGPDCPMN
ncbi:hypothetical protein X961_1725 [Burkholderia pseudomallei MSHR5613]|nr:hypothetical protein DP56_5741 [Burkholderia pseudomallei]KGS55054.1 hypothetical protein X961_1725 [Burkholderia pseudomallei MSHR5613]KGX95280.1 hypothetical protein Y023_5517 [Burkholderia pseudomallei A79D]